MNKLAKYALLLAGLLGVTGFFLPLLSVTYQGITGEISTVQIMTGIDKPSDHFKGASDDAIDTPEAQAAVVELNSRLKKARVVFFTMYVPSALLVLLALLAVAIRRFGRGMAVVALLCSLASLGIYALLLGVLSEVAKDGGEAAAGIGGHLIAASGALGVIIAIVGLVNPDTGVKVNLRHKATIANRPPSL